MSKDITIQISGVDTDFDDTERIKVSAKGGGSERFMPEDEAALEDITIKHNGTYTPGAGLYGFRKATVNVQIVTGKKNNVTYQVTVNDSGYLVYTEVSA